MGSQSAMPFLGCLISLQGDDIKFMGHVIFTGSVVFVWGVQAQVRNLAGIKAGKSLNLHHEMRLHERYYEIQITIAKSNLMTIDNRKAMRSSSTSVYHNIFTIRAVTFEKNTDLMCKARVLITSLHQLSPSLVKLQILASQKISIYEPDSIDVMLHKTWIPETRKFIT